LLDGYSVGRGNPIDFKSIAPDKSGDKKRKTLNMIPMGVAEK
jgi:hypothetical protein